MSFYDVNSLLYTKYYMGKNNMNGEKFVFREVNWLRYVKYETRILFVIIQN